MGDAKSERELADWTEHENGPITQSRTLAQFLTRESPTAVSLTPSQKTNAMSMTTKPARAVKTPDVCHSPTQNAEQPEVVG